MLRTLLCALAVVLMLKAGMPLATETPTAAFLFLPPLMVAVGVSCAGAWAALVLKLTAPAYVPQLTPPFFRPAESLRRPRVRVLSPRDLCRA